MFKWAGESTRSKILTFFFFLREERNNKNNNNYNLEGKTQTCQEFDAFCEIYIFKIHHKNLLENNGWKYENLLKISVN